MKIKCKIDCQVVDCQDCANMKKDAEEMLQEVKDKIKINMDVKELFDDFQSMVFLYERNDELINLCKARLRELGVTIPEEENSNG